MNVLITGAAGGLGRALAVECAKRGYRLLLTDLCRENLSLLAQGLIRQYDADVQIYPCDITDGRNAVAMFSWIREQKFRLDMLLNIAGIDFEGGFLQRKIEQLEEIIRLNVEATLRITHLALQSRRKNAKFYIVFVSSLAALYPMPLKATYAASKRFLFDFSIALGRELRRDKVSVLSLCPGGLPTTQEALYGIASQGFWGEATTNALEKVAHRTISRTLRQKKCYIPGLTNRTFSILGKLLPPALITGLLFRRWEHAQKQWLTI